MMAAFHAVLDVLELTCALAFLSTAVGFGASSGIRLAKWYWDKPAKSIAG